MTDKFLREDGISFIVDSSNRVWTIRELYDEDGEEVFDIEDAVTAKVTCAAMLLAGMANLTCMTHPEIN